MLIPFDKPIFSKPPTLNTSVLQKRIAALLLRKIKIYEVPVLLEQLLCKYDVYYAINLYIKKISPYNFEEIVKNPNFNSILLENKKLIESAYEITKEKSINLDILFNNLQKNQRNECLKHVENLKLISNLYKQKEDISLYLKNINKRLHEKLESRFQNWHNLSLDKIHLISLEIESYKRMQTEFNLLTWQLTNLITQLHGIYQINTIVSAIESEITKLSENFLNDTRKYNVFKPSIYYLIEKTKCLIISPELIDEYQLYITRQQKNY